MLFACAVLATAFATPLSKITDAEACAGLCLHAVRVSGNHVVAQLYYNGSALRNRIVGVVLNNRYTANISTNDSGILSMYAPLSLGRNTVSMRYEGLAANYLFCYLGNYLSLALLPVGAAFYIAIRMLSEHSAANKKVTVVFDGGQEHTCTMLDSKLVLDTAVRLRRSNELMRMVKALPVSVGEITTALREFANCRSASSIEEFVNTVCTDAYHGVICSGATPYREIATKRLYRPQ